jgi:hypothetical protein
MDAKSLHGEFMPKTTQGETYVMKTNYLITTESTDGSLTRLREAIRDKLCEFGPIKDRISAAKAAKEAAVAAKSQASSAASSRSSSPAPAPAPSSVKTTPKIAWGPETQVPPQPPGESPLLRRARPIPPAGQEALDAEAVAEEARKRFANQDAARAKSRGNAVVPDEWKQPLNPNDDFKLMTYDRNIAKLKNKEKLLKEQLQPKPPPTPPSNPRKPTTAKASLGGGSKQRTRKHPRIARAHHNTKRRSSNSKPVNHKHTRKARLTRASGSV